jgi:hypothetical protein
MWPFRRKGRAPIGIGDPEFALRVLTVLSPDQQKAIGGIPAEGIAGVIDGPVSPRQPIPPDRFRPNPAFAAFMQHVIGTLGPSDPELKAEARRRGSGSIGIIDLRTPEGVMGRVPLEDIVGIFAIENGEITNYHPNDKHVVFSVNGLVQLPPTLRDLHVLELMRLKVEPR